MYVGNLARKNNSLVSNLTYLSYDSKYIDKKIYSNQGTILNEKRKKMTMNKVGHGNKDSQRYKDIRYKVRIQCTGIAALLCFSILYFQK